MRILKGPFFVTLGNIWKPSRPLLLKDIKLLILIIHKLKRMLQKQDTDCTYSVNSDDIC